MASNTQRPLSPHLQVYKLPLTGLISITHRMTGIVLCCGLLLLGLMVVAVANGEASYVNMQAYLHSPWVKIIFWGNIYALCFHVCHGIRHLIWDAGCSFDKTTLQRYALIELGASALLTFICLVLL